MTTSRLRRFALAVIVLALLAGGLVLGHDHVSQPADAVLVATEVPAMPVTTPAGALTASWFCPGVRAPADGSSTGVVSVLNPSDSIVKATLTVVPSQGEPVARALEVKERSRLDVNLASVAAAPYAAALVEIVGSAGVVEQSETSASGGQSGPCSVGASPSWFFADGATTVDASYVLLAFNPFPDDAIVDFSFSTEEGTRTPQPLQGFVIPARSLRVIDVGSQVQRNTQVSLSAVARAGRFVLGRQQRYSGARKGLVASLATPSPGTAWWFPDVDKGAGSQQRFAIYNPGKVDQQVTLSLFPAAGAVVPDAVDPSAPTTSADTSTTAASPSTSAPATVPLVTDGAPIVATVSAGSSVIVDLAQNPAVPVGRYSASLTADGPGVVIEHVIDVTAAGQSGTSSMLGSRYTSESWLVVGSSSVGGADVVTIANATGAPNTITVATLGPAGSTPVTGFTSLVVPAAGLVQIDLVALAIAGKPLTVTGSTDLIVSRTTTATKVGLSVSLGIPSGHLTVPIGAATDDGTAGTGTDTATTEPSTTSESPTTSA